MAKAETNILNRIRLALTKRCTLFRNHTGMIKAEDGTVHRFGLCKGSSDLIGWQTVEISPTMVGKRIAIITAIEVKSPRGRATRDQLNFIRAVREAGGIAFVARSDSEAARILDEQTEELKNGKPNNGQGR